MMFLFFSKLSARGSFTWPEKPFFFSLIRKALPQLTASLWRCTLHLARGGICGTPHTIMSIGITLRSFSLSLSLSLVYYKHTPNYITYIIFHSWTQLVVVALFYSSPHTQTRRPIVSRRHNIIIIILCIW